MGWGLYQLVGMGWCWEGLQVLKPISPGAPAPPPAPCRVTKGSQGFFG